MEKTGFGILPRILGDKGHFDVWGATLVMSLPINLFSWMLNDLRYTCLVKLPENVNAEIDRQTYYRYNNDQDDEQRRYVCFTSPDNTKNNSICDCNEIAVTTRALTKRLTMMLPLTSVLMI